MCRPLRSARSARPRRSARHLVALLPLAALVAATGCDRGPERQVYVETLGQDTLAVEDFTLTEERIEGRILVRTPATRMATYEGMLDAQGRITDFRMELRTPGDAEDAPPAQRAEVRVEGDSATVIRATAEGADTARMAVPEGVIPTAGRIPMPVAVWQQVLRQMGAAPGEEREVAFILPGRLEPVENRVTWRGPDTAVMDFFGSPMLAVISEEGEVLSVSGRETTMKVEVRRATEPLDLEALAAEFAARDARGEGIGVASPADTARAEVGEAELQVAYSRPAKRGREIWGGLVEYGTVWRTGANAATQLTASRDLLVGDAEVPAGSYTLWSTYTPEEATLIVNGQTDIWGTAYDEAHDLVRVPMERRTLEEPAERFTIEIVPLEAGEEAGADAPQAELRLSWDTTRFVVPLRVR